MTVVRRLQLLAVAVLAFAALSMGERSAQAASGLVTFRWENSNVTVSTSRNAHSNVAGFWHAILNANGCAVTLDAFFGSQTKSATISWQAVLGIVQYGVVGPQTWKATHRARDPSGFRRLQATGFVDGFATAYYTYYDGGAVEAKLRCNSFGPQWLLNPFPASSGQTGWQLIPATINETIGSYPPCA